MPAESVRPTAAVRPAVAGLEGSLIAAVADYGRDRPGIIPLWFGEGDLPTPAIIRDAATAAMAAGHTKYTQRRGVPPLRAALARYMTAVYDRPIGVDRISVTASGMSAIQLSMQALLEPGRNAVIVSPVWPNAPHAARSLGAEVREVPLDLAPDGSYRLDLDRLFAAFDDRTALLFINSPSNPTGWMLDADAMPAILAECRRRGIWLLSDEVYARMVYDRPVAPSFLQVAEPEDRLIVVNSFSKTWAMTGWRLGWLTIPAAAARHFENLSEFNTSGAATFVQHAGIVAVEQGEDFVAEQVRTYGANRDRIFERLSQLPRVRLERPRASFYAWLSVDGEPDSVALARRLIDEAKVGLAPGAAFGRGGEGFLRLCFAGQPDTIEQALDRLVPVLR